MTKPLDEALARLREEVRLAEEHLASLAAEGAPLGEQLAAALGVYTARRAVASDPVATQSAGTEALARLFEPHPDNNTPQEQ